MSATSPGWDLRYPASHHRRPAFGDGWVFFYHSKRHQETGNLSDLFAGNAPILVDRDTGETHPTGTVRPVADYIHEYTEREQRNTS